MLTDYGLELSLTVPITNSLAFLFTVLGDWWVDRKVISRGKFNVRRALSNSRLYTSIKELRLIRGKDTWIGMLLSLGGIALCVQSKNK